MISDKLFISKSNYLLCFILIITRNVFFRCLLNQIYIALSNVWIFRCGINLILLPFVILVLDIAPLSEVDSMRKIFSTRNSIRQIWVINTIYKKSAVYRIHINCSILSIESFVELHVIHFSWFIPIKSVLSKIISHGSRISI